MNPQGNMIVCTKLYGNTFINYGDISQKNWKQLAALC